MTIFGGGEPAEGVVGALLVVIDHPPLRGFPNVFKPHEQVLIEPLLAEGQVEALHEGILVGLAGLDVLDCHAVVLCLSPVGKRTAHEIG